MAQNDFEPAIVRPIIDAVAKAFSVQLTMKAEVKSLRPPEATERLEVAVAAVMSLTSAEFNGTIALCFPVETFLKVVNKLLDEKFEKIDKENADAVAEILNIIYGVARPEINKTGYTFAPAIPSVVRGQNIKVSHPAAQIIGVMHCESDAGPFRLELSLKKLK